MFVFIEVKEDLAPSSLDGKLDAIDFAITRVFTRDMLLMPEDVAGDSPEPARGHRRAWLAQHRRRARSHRLRDVRSQAPQARLLQGSTSASTDA